MATKKHVNPFTQTPMNYKKTCESKAYDWQMLI